MKRQGSWCQPDAGFPCWQDQHTYFSGTTICLDNKEGNWQTPFFHHIPIFANLNVKASLQISKLLLFPSRTHTAKEKLHMQIIPCSFFYLTWGWNGDSIHFICTIFNNHLSKVGFYGVFFFFLSFLLNTCRKKEQVQFDSSTTTCAQNTDKKYRVKLK